MQLISFIPGVGPLLSSLLRVLLYIHNRGPILGKADFGGPVGVLPSESSSHYRHFNVSRVYLGDILVGVKAKKSFSAFLLVKGRIIPQRKLGVLGQSGIASSVKLSHNRPHRGRRRRSQSNLGLWASHAHRRPRGVYGATNGTLPALLGGRPPIGESDLTHFRPLLTKVTVL